MNRPHFTVETTDGDIRITPAARLRVSVASDFYRVNGVNYTFNAVAVLEEKGWEVAYLFGDRTPWSSKSDFGLTPAARRHLQQFLPIFLSKQITERSDHMFEAAETERRRIDLISLNRRIKQKQIELTALFEEASKLEEGDDYDLYPNEEN